MIRVADYARFSNDELQDERSLPDQQRLCQSLAARIAPGSGPIRHFEDPGVSGADPMIARPGLQALLRATAAGEIDIVVSESLDRLSRDAADMHTIHKLLTFAGVRLITVEEGEIDEMKVGFKSTMSALFLKGLGIKTRRGLLGQVERGKSAGGRAYGYRYDKARLVPDKKTGNLVPEPGVQVIHPEEAAIVLQVFQWYAAGLSGEAIAKRLNAAGVPSPRGGKWSPSTINGNWKRETGLLNQPLYDGRRIFGRQRFVKDPTRVPTPGMRSKRVARPNARSEWHVSEVPHLRIPGLTEELLQAVRLRQVAARQRVAAAARTNRKGDGIVRARRPIYLFSGLTECGICGAGFIVHSRDELRCFGRTKRGTCSNTRVLKRRELEARVLRALKERFLADPIAFAEFCAGFREQMNTFRLEQRERNAATKRELDRVARDIGKVIGAIKAGVPGAELKAEMEQLQARKEALLTQARTAAAPEPFLHPSMSDTYRMKVEQLANALEHEDEQLREAAREALRGFVTAIVIPAGDGLLEVRGDLGRMLAAAANGPRGAALATVAYVGCGGGI